MLGNLKRARRPAAFDRAFHPPGRGARWYGLWGAALGLGSPVGLGLLRFLMSHHDTVAAWAGAEIVFFGEAYLYTALGTVTAFSLLGYRLGLRVERVERRSREVERRAQKDALTGLLARGALMDQLALEIARARRYRTTLACLYMDLDGLKALNDKHGHRAGDLALQAVARAMTANARATDVLGRIGGDEFVAVLPHTTAVGARAAAERFRMAVARAPIRLGERTLNLSISVGVHVSWAGSAADFLGAADRALRSAKTAGKDRTALSRTGD